MDRKAHVFLENIDYKKIIKSYRDIKSYRKVGVLFDISKQTVANIVRKHSSIKTNRNLSDEAITDIIKKHKNSKGEMPVSDLAHSYKVNVSTIWRILNKAGVFNNHKKFFSLVPKIEEYLKRKKSRTDIKIIPCVKKNIYTTVYGWKFYLRKYNRCYLGFFNSNDKLLHVVYYSAKSKNVKVLFVREDEINEFVSKHKKI